MLNQANNTKFYIFLIKIFLISVSPAISSKFNFCIWIHIKLSFYFNAFDKVLDRLEKYKPDFLIFSAGFDAHKNDPLAQFQLTSEDFYEITKRTLAATHEFTEGRVVSILECGYDLNALAESANQHVNALIEFN